jgi:hypothetical protein
LDVGQAALTHPWNNGRPVRLRNVFRSSDAITARLLKNRTIPDILLHPELQRSKAQNLVAVGGFNP